MAILVTNAPSVALMFSQTILGYNDEPPGERRALDLRYVALRLMHLSKATGYETPYNLSPPFTLWYLTIAQ